MNFSGRGSTNGINFLSIKEPNPRRKFFVIARILSAEKNRTERILFFFNHLYLIKLKVCHIEKF